MPNNKTAAHVLKLPGLTILQTTLTIHTLNARRNKGTLKCSIWSSGSTNIDAAKAESVSINTNLENLKGMSESIRNEQMRPLQQESFVQPTVPLVVGIVALTSLLLPTLRQLRHWPMRLQPSRIVGSARG